MRLQNTYTDDIIKLLGNAAEKISEKEENTIQILMKAAFAVKKSKVKGPVQEIPLLGVKWQDGHHWISMDMVYQIAAMSLPTIKKETQAFLDAVGFWRMCLHITVSL